MNKLLGTAIAKQTQKQVTRLVAISEQSQSSNQSQIATPSGFDTSTGLYKATTPDGGEVQYMRGAYKVAPDQISILAAKNSLISFGDWR